MPKAKRAPVQPVAPAVKPPEPPPQNTMANPHNMEVKYHRLEIDEYSTVSAKGPADAQWCKDVMGWETEKEYQARMVAEKPDSRPEQWLFGENGPALEGGGFQPIHCKNAHGEKVVCWNNAHNRAFDETWCESLIHTVLYGQWAGPFTIPGETVNGEAIRISRYGNVVSGAHQMSACIIADEVLRKDREAGNDHPDHPKYPVWRGHGHVFIETIVVKGLSEDPRVLMTVDYTKPRSVADVFYTSELFKSCSPPERKELCKVLASAVDFLWTRTETQGYRTHVEVVAFLERHKKLLECVEHLFKINSPRAGRKISKLQLSPGHCAALCYLMGCSVPDEEFPAYGDDYRNMDPAPSERGLRWDNWEKSRSFWSGMADSRDFVPVLTALARLMDSSPEKDDNLGMGGKAPEKLAILSKAWDVYKDHEPEYGAPFTNEDLAKGGALYLNYSDLDDRGNKLPFGQIKLLDAADFYGIDCPPKRTEARDPPVEYTNEEMANALEEARLRRTRNN